jgi:hypothetical protein
VKRTNQINRSPWLKYVVIKDEAKYINSNRIFYSTESEAYTTDLYVSMMTSLKIIKIFGSNSKEIAISNQEL